MKYYVYLLASKKNKKIISYVGYTNNISKRLKLHNASKGAKFTRGKKWIILHKEVYFDKSKAMTREYKLKNDRKLRNLLKEKFVKMSNNKLN